MNCSKVTFACDDESSLKHTKVFQNKNLFHCYHNNRGNCSFRDSCKYKHFKEICSKTVCREIECYKRHPVICQYKDDCKFNKTDNCSFKHKEIKTDDAGNDLENKLNLFAKEIESLDSEIMNLKSDISNKEKELDKNRIERQELNKKLALLTNKQLLEKDIMKENTDL